MNIKLVDGLSHLDEIRELFGEYTSMLVKNCPEFAAYLEKQHFGSELENPEVKYGSAAGGTLFVAFANGEAAGCVGIKKYEGTACEMKRLYVREKFRGCGIGDVLISRAITSAEQLGYTNIYIDTLPFLTRAIEMYKRRGFYAVESYNNSPMESLVYLRLDLK